MTDQMAPLLTDGKTIVLPNFDNKYLSKCSWALLAKMNNKDI